MKAELFNAIDNQLSELWEIACDIFNHPEKGYHEFRAQNLLCSYLEKHGFQVDRGIGDVETAFRAVYQKGEGGPVIGLYCEYDCLPAGYHACGHHLQGPSAIGAAVAIKECFAEETPFTLVVYGTPAEESGGGKIVMVNNGCFQELDFIIGNHAGAETTTDPQTFGSKVFNVSFHGRGAHLQTHPEDARSAIDAVMLTMQGLEYMREHTIDRTRIHYSPSMVGQTGSPFVIPSEASLEVGLRSMSSLYLSQMHGRFKKIVEGAAMMTGTTYDIEEKTIYMPKFPIPTLIELFYKCAKEAGCKRVEPPRKNVGSSDLGNVLQVVPGIGIRIEFAPKGTGAHSKEWLEIGTEPCAFNYIKLSASTLASMCEAVIQNPTYYLAKIQTEYIEEKEKSNRA